MAAIHLIHAATFASSADNGPVGPEPPPNSTELDLGTRTIGSSYFGRSGILNPNPAYDLFIFPIAAGSTIYASTNDPVEGSNRPRIAFWNGEPGTVARTRTGLVADDDTTGDEWDQRQITVPASTTHAIFEVLSAAPAHVWRMN